MADHQFLTVGETAKTLGVSARHARRLADAGAVSRVARGLIDGASVDRYLHSQRRGRTRGWAQHTAWGAVAILAGRDAEWLGAAQSSRLRRRLREITDADDLLTRMRDRARVHIFAAHRAALPHLRDLVVAADKRSIGLSDMFDDTVDGYLAVDELDDVVQTLGLRSDVGGGVILRVTRFDFDRVRELVDTPVVAALDAATSTDPRQRGVGQRALHDLLAAHR
ncbi:hypothetical protein CLV56_3902 [Mumia flava]|uniref:Excisionase family DNA binding protein n=1 Tax=Mumia flava TaxID=1348852 RepID=A0A0B2BQY7_9ACTN|nr:helix-turn-helix domain-containing protein [Mumia flava]PJJ54392.1 hypothetical protein CLV56_3902 [Mumia flava]